MLDRNLSQKGTFCIPLGRLANFSILIVLLPTWPEMTWYATFCLPYCQFLAGSKNEILRMLQIEAKIQGGKYCWKMEFWKKSLLLSHGHGTPEMAWYTPFWAFWLQPIWGWQKVKIFTSQKTPFLTICHLGWLSLSSARGWRAKRVLEVLSDGLKANRGQNQRG